MEGIYAENRCGQGLQLNTHNYLSMLIDGYPCRFYCSQVGGLGKSIGFEDHIQLLLNKVVRQIGNSKAIRLQECFNKHRGLEIMFT